MNSSETVLDITMGYKDHPKAIRPSEVKLQIDAFAPTFTSIFFPRRRIAVHISRFHFLVVLSCCHRDICARSLAYTSCRLFDVCLSLHGNLCLRMQVNISRCAPSLTHWLAQKSLVSGLYPKEVHFFVEEISVRAIPKNDEKSQ